LSRLKAAERKRRQRQREEQAGLAQFTATVPQHVVPELRAICDVLRQNNFLEISPVPFRDPVSGRLVGLRRKKEEP